MDQLKQQRDLERIINALRRVRHPVATAVARAHARGNQYGGETYARPFYNAHRFGEPCRDRDMAQIVGAAANALYDKNHCIDISYRCQYIESLVESYLSKYG